MLIYFILGIILFVVIVITARAVNKSIGLKQNKSKDIINGKNKFY